MVSKSFIIFKSKTFPETMFTALTWIGTSVCQIVDYLIYQILFQKFRSHGTKLVEILGRIQVVVILNLHKP